ncbi:MAG: helicase-related protein [Candidatus Hatepunaea meridiana]|nr:helicase-related protein [Candidatus Hatepunaea meridiana]
MSTDLTFFTNEPGSTLLDRFRRTLKDVKFFDVLVGYFRSSGFHQLYKSLEDIHKIRVLVGISIDRQTFEIIDEARSQTELDFHSHQQTKRQFIKKTISEIDTSEDSLEIEIGIKKFLEFLTTDCQNIEDDLALGGNGKKMEFRVYPSENIHAKVYVSRYHPEDREYGQVITGSSNFSVSGLIANREFNVELKNRSDVEFALKQFEELWKEGVDVSRDYIDSIRLHTWLNDTISPYFLYLKMLYEYMKEDINMDLEIDINLPEGFLDLEYQKHAVLSTSKILNAYNGVFLADVVGLGKTFIAALLAQQLPGDKLVLCPPVLKEYWYDTFHDFGVTKYRIESVGKLDHILRRGIDKYKYIFIDEAHRFRNEYTQGFEKLHQICFGKKVILVSATPLNNTFEDILSQLKLFQMPRKSTVPGVPNLEKFFGRLTERLKNLEKSDPEYIEAVKEGSKEIREKVLKYLMVRRTRSEIVDYFSNDINKQGLFFPEVEDPKRFVYQFDKKIDAIFNKTIQRLKAFKYSRYTPLLYMKRDVSEFEKQSQRNVGGFMKGILVKRLESSFYAFRKTLTRFVQSYEHFIDMLDTGTVLISKKVNVYDLLEEDDVEKIQALVDAEDIKRYESDEFKPEFVTHLKSDLILLEEIRELWEEVDSDPKLETFIDELKTNEELVDKKLIIFTESKETGDYLHENLNAEFPDEVIFYSSGGGLFSDGSKSPSVARDRIMGNYDPTYKVQKDDARILISTDVLAEGINLHRSNIVINYDLPWNPTRVLQRVGRVNRIGTKHKHIYIYNFFPTAQSDIELKLEDNIKAKIQAFHDTLGEDAKYLTEDEVVSTHRLFGDNMYNKLQDKKTYEGAGYEDSRSELKYLKLIRDIRDNKPELFDKIKNLPKKARSGRTIETDKDRLITFFRKGKLKKFMMTSTEDSQEITFFDAVDQFECDETTKRSKIPDEYYQLLYRNKAMFNFLTSGEDLEPEKTRGGRSNEAYVIRRLKTKEFRKHSKFTDEDEEYVKIVLSAYEDGIIPKNTTKRIKNAIERVAEPLKVLAILKKNIPYNLLGVQQSGQSFESTKREIILSEYLISKGNADG